MNASRRGILAACLLTAALTSAPALAQLPAGHNYPPPTADSTAYHAQRFATLPKDEPANAQIAYTGTPLQLLSSTDGKPTSEPTIGVTPRGVAFMAGAGFDGRLGVIGHSHEYRSVDGGHSFQQIDPGSIAAFGADAGNDLDPYTYVDPDTGRVYIVPLAGAGSNINWSDDEGASWTSSFISAPGANDHQTVVTAIPPADSPIPQPAPTDPKLPKYLYYCVNAVDSSPCSRSTDGGQTFNPIAPAFTGTEAAMPGCVGALTGQLSADLQGRVFLPSGHCTYPEVSITEDGGLTWTQVYVSTTINSADTHTAVTADRGGNLYYTWFDRTHHHAWLSSSTDHGKTWGTPLDVTPPGVHEVNYPAIAAGDPGRIVISFPGTTVPRAKQGDPTDANRPWDAYVVVSTNALDADPSFVTSIFNPPNDPIHRGDCTGRCGGLFDFGKTVVSPQDGSFWAAWADDCEEETQCADDGRNGDGSISETKNFGITTREVGGPWLVGKGPNPGGQPPAAPPGGPGLLTPISSKAKPKITHIKVNRKLAGPHRARLKLAFTLSKAATVTARVRVVRVKGLKRNKVVALRRISGLKGVNRIVLKQKLRGGRYMVELRAVDAQGNKSNVARRKAPFKT